MRCILLYNQLNKKMAPLLLSSTDLNAKFKEGNYDYVDITVTKHFQTSPNDRVSAMKYLTALAFHLFHLPCGSLESSVAKSLARLSVQALEIFHKRSKGDLALTEQATYEDLEKIHNNCLNIIFRGKSGTNFANLMTHQAPSNVVANFVLPLSRFLFSGRTYGHHA